MGRINKSKHPEAYALLLSTLASAKLIYGDMQGTKTDMDEALKVRAANGFPVECHSVTFHFIDLR